MTPRTRQRPPVAAAGVADDCTGRRCVDTQASKPGLTLWDAGPGVRTADPATSQAAAGEDRRRLVERVAVELARAPGTDDELCERLELGPEHRGSIAKRRREAGAVDTGRRRPSRMGRPAIVWRYAPDAAWALPTEVVRILVEDAALLVAVARRQQLAGPERIAAGRVAHLVRSATVRPRPRRDRADAAWAASRADR